MIPSQLIEDIRNKADIVKVVSEYVALKKRGKNYLGSCPFHSEKDPSFTVSPEKQIFHCFGCGEGGNAFAFLMKIENIGFIEAVEELGSKVNVAVPKTINRGPSKNDKDKYFQIMSLAAKHFADNLESPAAKAVQEYLKQRNISDTTIKQFGLGFALPGWDNLFKYLVAKGAAPENIVKAGLILRRENSSGYYDRFRNRLIFPIANHRGQVVAFGGRTLGEDNPKYLNSPDTPIYHKGETLFGLNLTKNEIKKSRTAVLVEGNFDLITPFQAGVSNIVASMGTALTVSQCKLLARHCDTIVLAFDADIAGGIAAERSVELMRSQGLKVKVASLTGGKDPDEIINKHGAQTFNKILDSSLPFLEFKIKRIFSRYNLNEIEARAKAFREVAAVLSQAKDSFVQNEYAKLAARELKTTPENIMAEVKRLGHYQGAKSKNLRRITAKPSSKVLEAEKSIITLASQDTGALATVKEKLSVEDFNSLEAKAIAGLMLTVDFEDSSKLGHFLLDNLPDEAAKKQLAALLVSDHLPRDRKDEILDDCITVLKNARVMAKIEDIKQKIKAAEAAGESQKAAELLSALKSEIS